MDRSVERSKKSWKQDDPFSFDLKRSEKLPTCCVPEKRHLHERFMTVFIVVTAFHRFRVRKFLVENSNTHGEKESLQNWLLSSLITFLFESFLNLVVFEEALKQYLHWQNMMCKTLRNIDIG
jgi:hypothetical protein